MWTHKNPIVRPVTSSLQAIARASAASGRALTTGAQATRAGLTSRAGRVSLQATFTAALVAGFLAIGHILAPHSGPDWAYGDLPEPIEASERRALALTPEEAAYLDIPAPGSTGGFEELNFDEFDGPTRADPIDESNPVDSVSDLDSWASSLSSLGIPQRALVAYGRAELISAVHNPQCNLSWTTLAAIGQVESNHGTVGGNRIKPDGDTLRPIIGPDYDEEGPMQFLPSTWAEWGTSADGSAEANPHNIDDATVSAANFLCSGGRDLTDPADWYAAVYGYNPIETYVRNVFARADDYGQRSHQ
ncbi:lytic transglycosylase domain-containing protein [Natronoglycomyces albus]|uniref:Transglycosylase SLT domain-containing protein n=1 Tax=Natronoglycomyces albus TaxID=2811108 RepID=A0A895XTS8_9ACTN|nr:hypothetical protein [Natronoglycomyces albus]QSB05048.1 hypothetical protein JQS30_15000 [Natronoglycomyces albus]